MEQYKALSQSYSSRSIQQAPLGRDVCDMDFVPCKVSIDTYGLYGQASLFQNLGLSCNCPALGSTLGLKT